MRTTLTLALLAMSTAPSVQAGDNYLGYSVRSLTFTESVDETDAIVYEDAPFQAIDFTLSLGDNAFIGAALDLDQEQERSRQLLVKFGYGDWGAVVESGTVAGHFQNESGLDFQPPSGKFEYDYEGFKLYSRDGWNSKTGFSYAHWTQPSLIEVNLGLSDSYGYDMSWIDPEVEYTFYAWFMTNNLMERLTRGAEHEHGLNFESQVELGYMTVEPSGANVSAANNRVDGTIKSESAEGFATRSTFNVGFYGGAVLSDSSGFAWALGYEASLIGIVLGGRSSADENYVTTPNQFVIAHGPYVKLMGRF
ncbi:hypothetical protein ACQUQU_14110 [Thalassolituus sp. LLYu03]|uniref:hypothetical protein n=1 Tax=Thalassolituus sp. LLYu03 TaxID=3421656 RepID=UPI003D298E16